MGDPNWGLVVDIETTGLSPSLGRIIEIGLVEFVYDLEDDVPAPVITSNYSALEDPNEPLSGFTKSLTGITDLAVANRKIDWGTVQKYIDRASLLVAHNAKFERSFLSRVPSLNNIENKTWLCTYRHIPWKKKGYESAKLENLVKAHGITNPFAHRALFDSAVTFRLMTQYFEHLLEYTKKPKVRILAKGSPIERKDLLKGRGYRWKPSDDDDYEKYWWTVIPEEGLEEERTFLANNIYVMVDGKNHPDYHEEIFIGREIVYG